MTEKFRKKPIVVEAIQFTEKNKNQVKNWASELQQNVFHGWDENKKPMLVIPTLEGEMNCSLGDYLIKEPFPTDWRKVYPCKAEIFEKTYEKITVSEL